MLLRSLGRLSLRLLMLGLRLTTREGGTALGSYSPNMFIEGLRHGG